MIVMLCIEIIIKCENICKSTYQFKAILNLVFILKKIIFHFHLKSEVVYFLSGKLLYYRYIRTHNLTLKSPTDGTTSDLLSFPRCSNHVSVLNK